MEQYWNIFGTIAEQVRCTLLVPVPEQFQTSEHKNTILMRFIIFLNLFFCFLMIVYALCGIFAHMTNKPEKQKYPIPDPANLPDKVNSMEWAKGDSGRWELIKLEEPIF
jgi:hypothetical protein